MNVAQRIATFGYTQKFNKGAYRPANAPVAPEVKELRHQDVTLRNMLLQQERAKKPARSPSQIADVRTGFSQSEYTALSHPMHRAIVNEIRQSPIYKKLAEEYRALPGDLTNKLKLAKRKEIRQHLKEIINKHKSPYLQIAKASNKSRSTP